MQKKANKKKQRRLVTGRNNFQHSIRFRSSSGNSLRAVIPDEAAATASLRLPSASAPPLQSLVKSLHVVVTNGVADVMVTNRMTVFPSSPSVTGETTTVCVWVLSGKAARLRDSESALDFAQTPTSKKYTVAPRRDALKPWSPFIPENDAAAPIISAEAAGEMCRAVVAIGPK